MTGVTEKRDGRVFPIRGADGVIELGAPRQDGLEQFLDDGQTAPVNMRDRATFTQELARRLNWLSAGFNGTKYTEEQKAAMFSRVVAMMRVFEGRTTEDKKQTARAVRDLLKEIADPFWAEGLPVDEPTVLEARSLRETLLPDGKLLGGNPLDRAAWDAREAFIKTFPDFEVPIELIRDLVWARTTEVKKRRKGDPRPKAEACRNAILQRLALPLVADESAKKSGRRWKNRGQ